VGQLSQTIEVKAGGGQELQTTDSAVGNVISGAELESLLTYSACGHRTDTQFQHSVRHY
jgi:hypothetical protein